MWSIPVAKTATAPRYSVARAMVGRCGVTRLPPAEGVVAESMVIECSLDPMTWCSRGETEHARRSGHEARQRAFQRRRLPVPEGLAGRGDHHRCRPLADDEACDLSVGRLGGGVCVDHA